MPAIDACITKIFIVVWQDSAYSIIQRNFPTSLILFFFSEVWIAPKPIKLVSFFSMMFLFRSFIDKTNEKSPAKVSKTTT